MVFAFTPKNRGRDFYGSLFPRKLVDLVCSAKLLQNGGSRNISARELWREEAIGQKIKRGGKREEQRQRFCEANIFFEFYNIEISSSEILTTTRFSSFLILD